ncbi:ATP-dependent DNA helicase PIF1 [Microdochium nivale]|nr:ATP-dependent DNA helicase PIF1 [Microdochium nivale]
MPLAPCDTAHDIPYAQADGRPFPPIFDGDGWARSDASEPSVPVDDGSPTARHRQHQPPSVALHEPTEDEPSLELPPLPPFQGVRYLPAEMGATHSIAFRSPLYIDGGPQTPIPTAKREPTSPQPQVAYPLLPPSSSPDHGSFSCKRSAIADAASSPMFKKQRSDPVELTNLMSRSQFGRDERATLFPDTRISSPERHRHPEIVRELALQAFGREREMDLELSCPRAIENRDQDDVYEALPVTEQTNSARPGVEQLNKGQVGVNQEDESMPGAWPGSQPQSSPPTQHRLFLAPNKPATAYSNPATVPSTKPEPSPQSKSAPLNMFAAAVAAATAAAASAAPANPVTIPETEKHDRPPDEPPLCAEQAALVELIASGRNVFYTGSAGCGKSTVLKAFTKRLRAEGKRVQILAPTGRAALQVGGTTTWTFAGWRPDHHKRTLQELKNGAHGRFVSKRFRETDVIVIDEISMVENLHFERLNAILKDARGKDKAFGGIQIIATGDFCQLPPVRPFQHCIDCGHELIRKVCGDSVVYSCIRHGDYRDEDKWAFKSKAWAECNFEHVHLRKIHRQSDETFIKILQKCRMGELLLREETDLLMDHKCMVHHATKLFATRNEVSKVNTMEFNKLSGHKHVYWCLDEFRWQEHRHPHLARKAARDPRGTRPPGPLLELSDHRFTDCVELKRGMLVVLLVNLNLDAGLCNGSQGIICGFEPLDPAKLPRPRKNPRDEPENEIRGEMAHFKAEQIRQFISDPTVADKVWPVVRFHNGQKRVIFAECSIAELGDEEPYSLLVRTQIPLAPAWAMTIHKSQSLTLDRVIVNLSRAFEEGQVYVALSRATGLQGLKIEGDREGLLAGLGGNAEVQKFLRDKFGVSKS